ncbi:MAG TPA: HAD family phosphatase [Candidatus Paceibacterota bacterium]|nr:HAD family phosphatase [Candidatus Paceibacterota bacterium]
MKNKKIDKKYKAIIFDFDGTLVNSLPYHMRAFEDVIAERGIKIRDSEIKGLFGRPSKEIFSILRKNHPFKGSYDDLREERRYHFFKILDGHDIVFKGVYDLLEKLKKKYKLAIATGSSYTTYSHTANKRFQSFFDFTSTINDIKHGKPHPQQLFFVAKHLKVKPNECLVVGDSKYDGLAAKRAKMDYIGVTSGYTSKNELIKYNPLLVLKNVRELDKII